MIVDLKKMEIALAEKGSTIQEIIKLSKIGSPTMLKIRQGKDVRPVTIGKLAKALEMGVKDLIIENS